MRGLGAKDGTDSERRRAEVLRQDAEARKPSPLRLGFLKYFGSLFFWDEG